MIEDLKKTIEHLEHEETKKADEKLKYARDIEQVEEHYKVKYSITNVLFLYKISFYYLHL